MNIGSIEGLLIVGAIVALGLALGMQTPAESVIDRWLIAYGAPTDEDSRGRARRYLTRVKRSRFSCAFLAIVLYSLVTSRSDPPGWVNTVVVGLAGYLIGAIAAEVFRAQPARESFAGAMVSPRTLTAYVHRTAIVGLVATPIAGAVLAALYRDIDGRVPGRFQLEDPTTVVGAAIFGVAVAVVVWLALRSLVRRPQPSASADEVMLDDAVRSSSAHALAGAAVALEMLLLAFILSAYQQGLSADYSRFSGLVSFLMLLWLAAAIASWAIIGHPGRWRTRRPAPAGSPG